MAARVRRSIVVLLAFLLGSCTGSAEAPVPLDDAGLVVADHAGATLVIATLDPGAVGENRVRVFLRDTGGNPLGGAAHLSLRRGSEEIAASDVAAGGTAKLAVATPDRYELAVDARPDGQPAGTVRFPLTLPARRPDADLLVRVDDAMNALVGLRETQTLTSGGFIYVFDYDYQAPDRSRVSFVTPDGSTHETVFVGSRRFDRDGHGAWAESDLGAPLSTASFSFAAAPHRVRQIGSEQIDGRDTLVVALVSGAPPYERYYRLWIDATDLRVQHYTMMAVGHYMGGTYRDFNAPIEIAPPR